MTEKFVWDALGTQDYSSEYGSQELMGGAFSKLPEPLLPASFSMDAPGQTLTLVPTATSVWGTSHDGGLKAVEIDLENGALVMGDTPAPPTSDRVNFTMGPYLDKLAVDYSVVLTIADAAFQIQGLDRVTAGGSGHKTSNAMVHPRLNLKLTKTGRYQVDNCREYASCKDLSIEDESSVSIRAEKIILRGGKYSVASAPKAAAAGTVFSLDVECTGEETMFLYDMKMGYTKAATASFKAKQLSFVGESEIASDEGSTITIVSDRISFIRGAKAVFAIGNGNDNGNIDFRSYSGGKPFDFVIGGNQYPEGLFNFVAQPGPTPNKGQITIYGIGDPLQKKAMIRKRIVAIDGIPQDSDERINYTFDNNWTLTLSLK